jgi:serine/threonine-protein kinase
MAEVFVAEHTGAAGFGRPVCVKRILPDLAADDELRKLFVREARVAGRLTHANIVQVFDCIEEGPTLAIVMELVTGTDLRDLLRALRRKDRRLDEPLAAYITGQVLSGLRFAHRQGVIHRDVSPHNILVSRDGEVKLADFGVAKVLAAVHETRTGELKGKLPYMSPEQVRGKQGAVDHRTDLFSTGLVLYEMLRGKRFHEATSYGDLLGAVMHPEPPELAGVSPELSSVVVKLLALEVEDRFQSAEDALAALPTWAALGPIGAVRLGALVEEVAPARDAEESGEADVSEDSLRPPPSGPVAASSSSASGPDPACDGASPCIGGGTAILAARPEIELRIDRPVVAALPNMPTAPREDDVELAYSLAPTAEFDSVAPHDTIETSELSGAYPPPEPEAPTPDPGVPAPEPEVLASDRLPELRSHTRRGWIAAAVLFAVAVFLVSAWIGGRYLVIGLDGASGEPRPRDPLPLDPPPAVVPASSIAPATGDPGDAGVGPDAAPDGALDGCVGPDCARDEPSHSPGSRATHGEPGALEPAAPPDRTIPATPTGEPHRPRTPTPHPLYVDPFER